MAAMITVKCQNCKTPFEAREADRKRGWAKFCSKSCKAVKQTQQGGGKRNYKRHDGKSPMLYKFCEMCGEPAVNGVYTTTGIEWLCAEHMIVGQEHPFSSDALGQW